VIATGSQPRITPTPKEQRFSDTMAAPGMATGAAVAPAEPLPTPVPVAPTPVNADSYLNTVIADRYKILSKLGEGGMGVVYLAEHIFIEKRVALKVLSEDFARKPELVARFMQEAKAASKIGHENIVDITDFGETASKSVFFAMEFLDGMDLAGHIRQGGAMPLGRLRHIMSQICRALAAAHSKGIIHRDMKPENVYLVSREGKPDFVKVLDFGIAKMSALDEGGSRLTRTGMIFGTPEYMSPEQARGDRPDHRVDIYAVGCILYEMLTGDVPFHAETFMGVLTKHMFEPPLPPSQRNPAANIPADVEAVCLKALAKDRDQRFQTMKEMALALEACAGGDPNTAGWAGEPSSVMPVPAGLRDVSKPYALGPGGTQPGPLTAPPIGTVPPSTGSQATAPKSRLPVIAAVALALVAVAGAAAVLLNKKKPEAPPPVAAKVTPPVEPPAAPPPPVEAKPTQFTMAIDTVPAGAEVMNGAEVLGVTPFDLVLPVSTTPVELTLKKKGFRDQSLKVTPDKNHHYLADLLPASRAKPAPAKPAAAKPARPEAPAAATPAKPAAPEPAAPKAAGKLRDLKDPFAN
jgi:serine/threonine-protein kinase